MSKILIAEDDRLLASSIEQWLLREQHLVDLTVSGVDTLNSLTSIGYDATILDWDLPDLSGLDLLKKFRATGGTTPVLMLTGKQSVAEKEAALDAGADDYLTKPFHPRELTARLRALLRRPNQLVTRELKFKNITLRTDLRKVTLDHKQIYLQPLECAVLEFLLRHPNEVLSPEAILNRAWDSDCDVSLDAIYTCIKKLRKKLDNEGGSSLIRTVHGAGYTIEG